MGQRPVAVDLNSLRKMTSETVYSVDWPLTPILYMAVSPERQLHGASASHKSVQYLPYTIGHRSAYASLRV